MQGKLVKSMIRTRIAPSPTGYPHIATVYQALFDYGYAKRFGGKFIVRIEDTDRERLVLDAEEKLYEALDWFGLIEDESSRKDGAYGPYHQSQRLAIYQKYAHELLDTDKAYYCFCSKERLVEIRTRQQLERKPIMYDRFCRNLSPEEVSKNLALGKSHVIRLKVPDDKIIVGHDEIRGDIEFASETVDDQVLVKADGFPTYHLAVVVDDHLMQISDVVRGEEWIPSFPKHVLLYQFLGWDLPKFYHTPVLRNPDKSKLSKRQGHTNISWYQQEGYLPQAILNYIALLGWSHPEQKEIFSLSEFIQYVDLKDLKPQGPIFDIVKLNWMNGVYIREMKTEDLGKKLLMRFPAYKKLDKGIFLDIVDMAKTRLETLKAFDQLACHFITYQKHPLTDQEKPIAKDLHDRLSSLDSWTAEKILDICRGILKSHSIKMNILYTILTGSERGLPLPESIVLLGRDQTLNRLIR